MAEQAFGCRPLVINLPYRAHLPAFALQGFTMIITGCNSPIRGAFAQHPIFWLNSVPPRNLNIDGFDVHPESLPADQARGFQRISPTPMNYQRDILTASDDWPFLYLSGRVIPNFTVRSMVLLGILGLGMVYLFLPKGRIALDSRMFFLGAAFMLLETRAVTQIALLFGSSWLVNSAVFFTILILILAANVFVLLTRGGNLLWSYIGLTIFLIVGAFVPPDLFLSGGTVWRYAIPCGLALSPVLFAGVIFARSFRNAAYPELAFGSNIAGAVVGGLAESFSTILGFQHLLLVALAFYLLSAWSPKLGSRQPVADLR